MYLILVCNISISNTRLVKFRQRRPIILIKRKCVDALYLQMKRSERITRAIVRMKTDKERRNSSHTIARRPD